MFFMLGLIRKGLLYLIFILLHCNILYDIVISSKIFRGSLKLGHCPPGKGHTCIRVNVKGLKMVFGVNLGVNLRVNLDLYQLQRNCVLRL